MTRRFELTNYSGSRFDCAVRRTVRLLDVESISAGLAAPIPTSLRSVGFESVNALLNASPDPWRQESGLVCIWILGMFKPLPKGVVIVPFVPGDEQVLGPKVKAYFGEIPPERLQIDGDHALFRCDGSYRSKIGVPRLRSRSILASSGPEAYVLTFVTFNLPLAAPRLPYVNSQWEIQKDPYNGDVVNSYNDGRDPITEQVLGPFYELETSSAAAKVEPGGTAVHVHRTCHFTGPRRPCHNCREPCLAMT